MRKISLLFDMWVLLVYMMGIPFIWFLAVVGGASWNIYALIILWTSLALITIWIPSKTDQEGEQ